MIKARNIIAGMIAAVILLVAACDVDRQPCLDASVNVVRAGAYRRADTGTAFVDTALRAPLFIALDALSDTNTFIQTTTTNKFRFQLSDLADTTRWVLRPDSAGGLQDTISFIYQRQLHFINNACGYNYYYSLQQVTSTRYLIDSIQLAIPAVTSDASVEHIKIFY